MIKSVSFRYKLLKLIYYKIVSFLEKQGILLVNAAYAKFLPIECQEVAFYLSFIYLSYEKFR